MRNPSQANDAGAGPDALVLLVSVFLVAVAALVYELVAGAVSSYLLGGSVTQFSLVIGIFLTAMGGGSFLSKYVRRNLVVRFIQVEVAVGTLGGCSAALLFAGFTYTKSYMPIMVIVTGSIGVLIGLEIPIIIRILKERSDSLRITVSNVLALDYVGALAASVAFPFILVPHLGLLRSSFAFGLMNLGVAWLGIRYFRDRIPRPLPLQVFAGGGVLVTGLGLLFAPQFLDMLEERIYQDQVIYSKQTKYQRIVVTRWRDDIRLFLDRKLQFSTKDEYRYHECLVHPAMGMAQGRGRVLVLGGGDGLAVRELLKYTEVQAIDLVDIDPEMTRIFRETDLLRRVNSDSLNDERVTVFNRDAMKFLEETDKVYDVILADLPDPNNLTLGKLYTKSFYALAARRLKADGVMAVQSASPFFSKTAFWCIVNTLDATPASNGTDGTLSVLPYHVNVPSFGEWGFTLASPGALSARNARLLVKGRYLNQATLERLFVFPEDMRRQKTLINRLDNQALVEYYERGYDEFSP